MFLLSIFSCKYITTSVSLACPTEMFNHVLKLKDIKNQRHCLLL